MSSRERSRMEITSRPFSPIRTAERGGEHNRLAVAHPGATAKPAQRAGFRVPRTPGTFTISALFGMVALVWGFNYLFVREGLAELPPLWLATF
jgi:hypothetical protein